MMMMDKVPVSSSDTTFAMLTETMFIIHVQSLPVLPTSWVESRRGKSSSKHASSTFSSVTTCS